MRPGFLVLVLVLFAASAPVHAELVLNEFLADPASDWNGDGEIDATLDEWVEVHNPGPDSVSLTAYWLRDGLGDAPHLNLFGTLQPGQTAVFHGHHAVAWQQENGGGSSGLSLNNGGDTIVLLRTNEADPDQLDVIDSVTYPSHVGEDDRASGRLLDGDAWLLFDGLNPYDGELAPLGTGCEPTPGATNACDGGTPVATHSWSAVKACLE